MEIKDLPEPRLTDDAKVLGAYPPRERLPKYDDNCRSKEKFQFSDQLADEMVKATSPLALDDPAR